MCVRGLGCLESLIGLGEAVDLGGTIGADWFLTVSVSFPSSVTAQQPKQGGPPYLVLRIRCPSPVTPEIPSPREAKVRVYRLEFEDVGEAMRLEPKTLRKGA